MTRSELKNLVMDCCIDPFGFNCFDPISVSDARSWLQDIFRDQELSELEPDECIPHDTTPEAFMEVWNEICVEQIRSKVTCDDVPVEDAFIGKKTGSIILIQRYGSNDYGALWYDTYSVRGTLKDIMEEVKEEI